uniref:polymorphic toxin type 33 domain-containing protein n=1 Tax=Mesobacillus boroniphilus TaxID=308892 RepID=UPI000557D7A0
HLKRKGINAHDLKKEFIGRKAKIAHYDIYKDKRTGQLYIYKKGGKGTGIPTGTYI